LSRELEKLEAKRANWLSLFDLQKTNSIAAQLCSLTWDVTGFEIFQECVRLCPDAPDGGKQLNGTVFRLLTRCFFKSFMSDVRKLVDNSKGSVSLRRALEDMRSNSSLFT
jgi:hypothetical protein